MLSRLYVNLVYVCAYYIDVFICERKYLYVRVFMLFLHILIQVCMYILMFLQVCLHACFCMYMFTRMCLHTLDKVLMSPRFLPPCVYVGS